MKENGKGMSRDKKYGIAMLVTIILSVTNTIAAFAAGAWILPSVKLSDVFETNQVLLMLVFLCEFCAWAW